MPGILKLSGIIPPVLTPITEDCSSSTDTLDVNGLEQVLERLLSGGVQGLFILGTTGEGPSVRYSMRREMIRETCRIAAGRVPVLVGITDTAMDESIRIADYAAENGAAAVVAAPPCYHVIGQNDLLQYLEQLARRLPLPAFLYNMPSCCKMWYELDTLRRAFEIDRYIGLKDSSHDMDYFKKAAEIILPKNLTLLIGPEELLPEALALGAQGGICGGAHILPRLFVRMVEAFHNGDSDAMKTLTKRAGDLGSVYRAGGGNFLKSMKAAMSVLGLCENRLLPPIQPLGREAVEKIRQKMAELGIDRSTLE